VISAKPGTVPATATVNIKPKVAVAPPVRPQVKPPSQLQMPVVAKEKSQSSISVENANDLDTNVFLNE
jgi:hypothetical protein